MADNNFIVLKGRCESADYKEQVLFDYTDNPLIEALPPIMSDEDVINNISNLPYFNENERELDNKIRTHCVQRLSDFVEVLPIHLDVEGRISRMIRHGYKARHPFSTDYVRLLRSKDILNASNPIIHSTASGFNIIGISGIGKSTTVVRILTSYPQVIVHSKYKEENLSLYQLVWLKLECPHDGSLRGLCLNFFQAVDSILGSNYYLENCKGRKSVEELIPIMTKIAANCYLGVLVIDEIQNLSKAKSGGDEKMLNFFVRLVNTLGLPVLLIGTYKAMGLYGSQLRNSRRGCGQGDLIIKRMQFDEEWRFLIERMWKYQWTRKPVPLTEELLNVIYDQSQGIIDIAVKVFMLAQWRAISDGTEKITAALIKKVANDSLKLIQPFIQALREDNIELLAKFEDVYLPKDFLDNHLENTIASIEQKHRLELIRQDLKERNDSNNESKISHVTSWLVQAGIESKLAQKTAEKIVNLNKSMNVHELCQEAFKVLLNSKEEQNHKETVVKPSVKKINKTGLLQVVSVGKKHKIPPYESLKDSGFIKKPMNEFAVL